MLDFIAWSLIYGGGTVSILLGITWLVLKCYLIPKAERNCLLLNKFSPDFVSPTNANSSSSNFSSRPYLRN